jgi:hypothetical protein
MTEQKREDSPADELERDLLARVGTDDEPSRADWDELDQAILDEVLAELDALDALDAPDAGESE